MDQTSLEVLDTIYENYLKNHNLSHLNQILSEINDHIQEQLKLLISLNYDLPISEFLDKLSKQDKHEFLSSKTHVFFKVKTINCLINEVISDENEYDNKILNYLNEIKLGEAGRGASTKQILTHIGGNATSLRNRLMALSAKNLVYPLGRTKSKTWVIYSLKKEALQTINKELGITR